MERATAVSVTVTAGGLSACDSIAVVGVAVTDVVTAAAAEAAALVDRSTCLPVALVVQCKNERSHECWLLIHSAMRKAARVLRENKALSLAAVVRFRPTTNKKSMDNVYGEVSVVGESSSSCGKSGESFEAADF
jgi:hypothetical protein